MNELEWLTESARTWRDPTTRPPPAPAPRCWPTRRGRADPRGCAAPATATRRDRRGRAPPRAPRKAPLYALAAAVFAVAIVVVAGALPSGDGADPRISRIVGGPAPAEAALVKLSQRIKAAPTPTGDATLVLRSHHFPPPAKDFTGADLYFDDGRYYYGITLAELEQNTNDIGEGVPKLEREAAKAAITLPSDQARRRMIDATFGPHGEPAPGSPPAKAAEATRKAKLEHMTGPTPTPAPKLMIDNNRVWLGCHGRPDRRRRRPRCPRGRDAAPEHDRRRSRSPTMARRSTSATRSSPTATRRR